MSDNFSLVTFAGSAPPWSLPSLDANLLKLSTGLTARCVSVMDPLFGAVGNGVADDTVAIQAAIDYFVNGNGLVFLPAGIYLLTSGLLIAKDGIHFAGAGMRATSILFSPTANGVAITVDKGSTVAYQGSIRNMTFYSNDTTYAKTAIKVVDTSSYVVEDVGTIYPNWYGAGSIFLNVCGREFGSFHRIAAFADRPIVISQIPAPHVAAGIGIDHSEFHHLHLGADAAYPVITIETGTNVTQTSFRAPFAAVGGSNAIEWIDTTSIGVSNGVLIEGMRTEQAADPTKYAINIQHNVSLQGLRIIGGTVGDRRGVNLRKVENTTIDNWWYTLAGAEALNVDASVKRITGTNCFFQATTTATITGQRLIYATPLNPNTGALPPNFIYDEATNALTKSTNQGSMGVGGHLSLQVGTSTSVTGATTIYTISGPTPMAFVMVTGDSGTAGFADMVAFISSGAAIVIGGGTTYGAPAVRTYTVSGGDLQLAMAAGTYTVKAAPFEVA